VPNPSPVSLHASGAETTSNAGTALDLGTLRQALRLRLDVSAVANLGTSPFKVFVETGPTSAGPWKNLGGYAPVMQGATYQWLAFAPCERFVRARWELPSSGSPSATFELGGDALVVYALLDDVDRYGLKKDAWGKATVSDVVLQLIAASDEADGYINNAFTLPLTAWGSDLRMHVARLASVTLIENRGLKPDGNDALFRLWRDDAVGWLKRIGQGQLTPPGFVDSTPEVYDAGAYVVSEPARGW
jgi:phage gp36-like protein